MPTLLSWAQLKRGRYASTNLSHCRKSPSTRLTQATKPRSKYSKRLIEIAYLFEQETLSPLPIQVVGGISVEKVQQVHMLLESNGAKGKLIMTIQERRVAMNAASIEQASPGHSKASLKRLSCISGNLATSNIRKCTSSWKTSRLQVAPKAHTGVEAIIVDKLERLARNALHAISSAILSSYYDV